MKKRTRFKILLSYFLLAFIVLFIFSFRVSARRYQPEISGSFESGDRVFTDPGFLADGREGQVDYYQYDKQWLRYRQQLAVGEYYFFRLQRQQRIYEQSNNYDNLTLQADANYTFYLSENLRNRFVLMLRDKDYLAAEYEDKDHQAFRLQYTLQYDLNQNHDCELILQRQWNKYHLNQAADSRADRISFNWGWKVNDNLNLNSRLQFDSQKNHRDSASTDKKGRRLTVNFRYRL